MSKFSFGTTTQLPIHLPNHTNAYTRAHTAAQEFLDKSEEEHDNRHSENSPAATPEPAVSICRRAIYSHHIIADTKCQAVRENAIDLDLGGLVKHGWCVAVLSFSMCLCVCVCVCVCVRARACALPPFSFSRPSFFLSLTQSELSLFP